MKRSALLVWTTLLSLGSARSAFADWVIFLDGQAAHVLAFELTETTVNMVTPTGKRWSILKSVVDIPRTRYYNNLGPDGRHSPGWIVFFAEGSTTPPEKVSSPPPSLQATQVMESPAPPPLVPVAVGSSPPPREVVQLPSPDEASPPESSSRPRFAVFLNGNVGTEPLQFGDSRSFDLFGERALIDSRYADAKPQGPEVGALLRIVGPIAVGASYESFRNERTALYTASLPHPFFYDRFREISGALSGLSHEETAVHVDAAVTKTMGPLTLDVVGGPSWFFTKTEVLSDLLYDEVFPFDSVVPQGVQTQLFENRLLGFNVGASATYRIAGIFGVDFAVRYSRAEMRFLLDETRVLELQAGGLRLGAGLRFLFP